MPETSQPPPQPARIPGLAPEATPLIGLGLGITGLMLGLRPRLAPLPLLATATAALLFRDPTRVTPQDELTLFAPADGVVSAIDELYEHRFLHTDAVRISITRSLFDVHVTRSPVAGQIRYVEHSARGQQASKAAPPDERNYIGIFASWGPLLVVQSTDVVARRIVCRVRPGDEVEPGQRVGLVRFGSRVDLIIPHDAVRLSATPGQRVRGGLSELGMVL
jgi:phosphatidylserine decarboxylase